MKNLKRIEKDLHDITERRANRLSKRKSYSPEALEGYDAADVAELEALLVEARAAADEERIAAKRSLLLAQYGEPDALSNAKTLTDYVTMSRLEEPSMDAGEIAGRIKALGITDAPAERRFVWMAFAHQRHAQGLARARAGQRVEKGFDALDKIIREEDDQRHDSIAVAQDLIRTLNTTGNDTPNAIETALKKVRQGRDGREGRQPAKAVYHTTL